MSDPSEVKDVLRYAAEQYYEASAELTSAWQDKNAGKPWEQIARILERAISSIEKLGY